MMKLLAIASAAIIAVGGSVVAVTGALGDGVCSGQGSAPTLPQPDTTVPGESPETGAEPPDIDPRALRGAGRAFATPRLGDDPTQTDTAATSQAAAGNAADGGIDGVLEGEQVLGGKGGVCAGGVGGSGWDAGNIIADDVFYNAATMDAEGIAAFLADKGVACASNCLKDLMLDTVSMPGDAYCGAYSGGPNLPIAVVFADVSRACGINPQVLLVMLEKESSLVTAVSPAASRYAAAFGYACPDAGPGGAAECNGANAGMWQQTWGIAHQLARYRVEIPKGGIGRYQPGVTVDILWNVAESGCGAAPVTIANVATASLYTYTPYQPNQAALDAYPGTGDECSSYGNRNFFFLFQDWFGATGGGAPTGKMPGGGQLGPTQVQIVGAVVIIPQAPTVPAGVGGRQVVAPSPQVAAAIAAGMTWLGTPYSWGGGAAGGPSFGICADGPAYNDCHIVGFDCSGLTSYVAARFGASLPRYSGDQRDGAHGVPWSQAMPGDLVGYPGHIAIYLGRFDGTGYMLEAPESGRDIQIRPVRSGFDPVVYRYWT